MGIVVVSADSSSAKSCVSERGLGKMRHIEVKGLRLQEAVCRGRVNIYKILGTSNPADLFTKYLPYDDALKHLRRLGIQMLWRGFDPTAA